MNRKVFLMAIREMALAMRNCNCCNELESVYDSIINACNEGIYFLNKQGWSE